MSTRIEAARKRFSQFALEWFERGLEFALAAGTFANGVLVFGQRRDGSSLAPYLSSALSYLSYEPRQWAITLFFISLVYHVVLIHSIYRETLKLRLAMASMLFLFYLVVAVTVLTGDESFVGSIRYFISAGLALGATTALCILLKSPRTCSIDENEGAKAVRD